MATSQTNATKFAQNLFGKSKAIKITKKESESLTNMGSIVQHSEDFYRKNLKPQYEFDYGNTED